MNRQKMRPITLVKPTPSTPSSSTPNNGPIAPTENGVQSKKVENSDTMKSKTTSEAESSKPELKIMKVDVSKFESKPSTSSSTVTTNGTRPRIVLKQKSKLDLSKFEQNSLDRETSKPKVKTVIRRVIKKVTKSNSEETKTESVTNEEAVKVEAKISETPKLETVKSTIDKYLNENGKEITPDPVEIIEDEKDKQEESKKEKSLELKPTINSINVEKIDTVPPLKPPDSPLIEKKTETNMPPKVSPKPMNYCPLSLNVENKNHSAIKQENDNLLLRSEKIICKVKEESITTKTSTQEDQAMNLEDVKIQKKFNTDAVKAISKENEEQNKAFTSESAKKVDLNSEQVIKNASKENLSKITSEISNSNITNGMQYKSTNITLNKSVTVTSNGVENEKSILTSGKLVISNEIEMNKSNITSQKSASKISNEIQKDTIITSDKSATVISNRTQKQESIMNSEKSATVISNGMKKDEKTNIASDKPATIISNGVQKEESIISSEKSTSVIATKVQNDSLIITSQNSTSAITNGIQNDEKTNVTSEKSETVILNGIQKDEKVNITSDKSVTVISNGVEKKNLIITSDKSTTVILNGTQKQESIMNSEKSATVITNEIKNDEKLNIVSDKRATITSNGAQKEESIISPEKSIGVISNEVQKDKLTLQNATTAISNGIQKDEKTNVTSEKSPTVILNGIQRDEKINITSENSATIISNGIQKVGGTRITSEKSATVISNGADKEKSIITLEKTANGIQKKETFITSDKSSTCISNESEKEKSIITLAKSAILISNKDQKDEKSNITTEKSITIISNGIKNDEKTNIASNESEKITSNRLQKEVTSEKPEVIISSSIQKDEKTNITSQKSETVISNGIHKDEKTDIAINKSVTVTSNGTLKNPSIITSDNSIITSDKSVISNGIQMVEKKNLTSDNSATVISNGARKEESIITLDKSSTVISNGSLEDEKNKVSSEKSATLILNGTRKEESIMTSEKSATVISNRARKEESIITSEKSATVISNEAQKDFSKTTSEKTAISNELSSQSIASTEIKDSTIKTTAEKTVVKLENMSYTENLNKIISKTSSGLEQNIKNIEKFTITQETSLSSSKLVSKVLQNGDNKTLENVLIKPEMPQLKIENDSEDEKLGQKLTVLQKIEQRLASSKNLIESNENPKFDSSKAQNNSMKSETSAEIALITPSSIKVHQIIHSKAIIHDKDVKLSATVSNGVSEAYLKPASFTGMPLDIKLVAKSREKEPIASQILINGLKEGSVKFINQTEPKIVEPAKADSDIKTAINGFEKNSEKSVKTQSDVFQKSSKAESPVKLSDKEPIKSQISTNVVDGSGKSVIEPKTLQDVILKSSVKPLKDLDLKKGQEMILKNSLTNGPKEETDKLAKEIEPKASTDTTLKISESDSTKKEPTEPQCLTNGPKEVSVTSVKEIEPKTFQNVMLMSSKVESFKKSSEKEHLKSQCFINDPMKSANELEPKDEQNDIIKSTEKEPQSHTKELRENPDKNLTAEMSNIDTNNSKNLTKKTEKTESKASQANGALDLPKIPQEPPIKPEMTQKVIEGGTNFPIKPSVPSVLTNGFKDDPIQLPLIRPSTRANRLKPEDTILKTFTSENVKISDLLLGGNLQPIPQSQSCFRRASSERPEGNKNNSINQSKSIAIPYQNHEVNTTTPPMTGLKSSPIDMKTDSKPSSSYLNGKINTDMKSGNLFPRFKLLDGISDGNKSPIISSLLKNNLLSSSLDSKQGTLSALITGKSPELSSIQKSPSLSDLLTYNQTTQNSQISNVSHTVEEKMKLLKSELKAAQSVEIPRLKREPRSFSYHESADTLSEMKSFPYSNKKVLKPIIPPMLPIQKSNTFAAPHEGSMKLPPPPPTSNTGTLRKIFSSDSKKRQSLPLSLSRTSTLDDFSKSTKDSSYVSRSPSPFITHSISSSTISDSGRSSRSATPLRSFPQQYDDDDSMNLHEYFQMEQAPVVIDANLSFIMGCGNQPIKQTVKMQPAHKEKSTGSSHLSDQIQKFLTRTDHVMEEWKALGHKPTLEEELVDCRRGTYRSKSVSNIMIKGFQMTKDQPRTERSRSRTGSICSSRATSVSQDLDFDFDDDNATIVDESELSEMTAEFAEEQSSSNVIGERLEAETTERLRLEKEIKEYETKYKNLQESSEKLEMELLCAKSDLNGDLDDDDHDNDDNRDNVYRQKYERVARELEFTKKRLQTQHEHDLEQLIGLKKQLEKKLADAYEEVEEQRQVVGQWKRKAQKMTNEMNDLRMLLDEQNSRNNLLEKKQRKFDSECQTLQDAHRQEKLAKERLQREKDVFNAEKFTLEQTLSDVRLELELKEEKYSALQRELDEMTFGGGTEEEIANLKRTKMDLDRKCKEQEEELDEMAGQIQLLEQAKLRLEMTLETMRKDARKEAQQRDDELEEIRGSSYKKIKTLECQLEQEHEERTLLLREKHELERRLNNLEENDRHEKAVEEAMVQKMKRDLRKYKALLRDAQSQLERAKSDGAGKAMIRQLRNQLEDVEGARAIAVKSKQTAESELQDVQLQLEEAQRARYEAEEKATAAQRDRTELQAQIDENEEEMAELLKKYSLTVKQMNTQQSSISEYEIRISELETEKKSMKDQISELTARLENVESMGDSSTSIQNKRLELRAKELESRLEFEHTTRARMEVQLNRHKDALDKAQTEISQARAKEIQAQESLKKSQKSLRELREEFHSISNKEQEAMSRRKDLEKQLETVEAEAASARADLRLALQRISDLQQAMEEGDSYHSDSDNSESSIDSLSELNFRANSSLSHVSDYARKLRTSTDSNGDNTTLCIREEKDNTPRITLTTAATATKSKTKVVSRMTNGGDGGVGSGSSSYA